MKFAEIRGYRSSCYHVYTKAVVISKGSYGEGEPKNINLGLVQEAYLPEGAIKLAGFMQRRIRPIIEICGNSGLYIVAVPFLHQSNSYIKRKLQGWRTQKYKPWFSARSVLPRRGHQTRRFRATSYRPIIEIRGYLTSWYHFCTKAIVISNGSYGGGEPKNINLGSVQEAYFPEGAIKLEGFTQRRIGPIVEVHGHLTSGVAKPGPGRA